MIATRLTTRFGLDHPIVSAPMAAAAGGRLAAAVSAGGGLGLIGGGYGDAAWIRDQVDLAGPSQVGIGFITWSVTEGVLAEALERRPAAVMLSFGDPGALGAMVRKAGVPLILQVQTLDQARAALDAGADAIVAQGAEGGGHGLRRATMTLVPEVADLLAARGPETLLLAAGGIADGRGLAAALMLGADGALVGSRFWAAEEALVARGLVSAAMKATGDATVRTTVPDAARGLTWPGEFTIRSMRNAFSDRWRGQEHQLRHTPQAQAAWRDAMADGDAETGTPIVGEATGLIRDCVPAVEILARMVAEAEDHLARGQKMTGR